MEMDDLDARVQPGLIIQVLGFLNPLVRVLEPGRQGIAKQAERVENRGHDQQQKGEFEALFRSSVGYEQQDNSDRRNHKRIAAVEIERIVRESSKAHGTSVVCRQGGGWSRNQALKVTIAQLRPFCM